MASYHSKFIYNGEDSAKNYGLIITSFEPDNGFVDSFLSMDNVSDDYYDGTKKYNYGSKYNTQASIQITLIKHDGTDMKLNEFRSYAKWLTGARVDSWLDMYAGDSFVYSFLGKFTNLEQYKLDGRTIGIRLTFSSMSPWAYSAPQIFDRSIKQALLFENGILRKEPVDEMSIDSEGVLCNSRTPGPGACFCIDDNGVLYVENNIVALIDNETDDLYNYIYLDIEFDNESCNELSIINRTLGETTEIKNLKPGHIITLSAKQFIAEYSRDERTNELVNNNRIFGDSFNFVWPRLAPGENDLHIVGQGNGTVKFTYRYPMKVGDNTMDISVYGSGTSCGDCDSIPSYNTVRWEDIVGTPTTLGGYGIADEVDEKIENADIEWSDIDNTPTTVEGYEISDAYTKSEVYTKAEVDDKIDNIEISGGGGGSTKIDEEELNSMLNDILG